MIYLNLSFPFSCVLCWTNHWTFNFSKDIQQGICSSCDRVGVDLSMSAHVHIYNYIWVLITFVYVTGPNSTTKNVMQKKSRWRKRKQNRFLKKLILVFLMNLWDFVSYHLLTVRLQVDTVICVIIIIIITLFISPLTGSVSSWVCLCLIYHEVTWQSRFDHFTKAFWVKITLQSQVFEVLVMWLKLTTDWCVSLLDLTECKKIELHIVTELLIDLTECKKIELCILTELFIAHLSFGGNAWRRNLRYSLMFSCHAV